MGDKLNYKNKDKSGVEGDVRLTREEVRAIKELVEDEITHGDGYKYDLGGSNWTDLDNLRYKCKKFLVHNQ